MSKQWQWLAISHKQPKAGHVYTTFNHLRARHPDTNEAHQAITHSTISSLFTTSTYTMHTLRATLPAPGPNSWPVNRSPARADGTNIARPHRSSQQQVPAPVYKVSQNTNNQSRYSHPQWGQGQSTRPSLASLAPRPGQAQNPNLQMLRNQGQSTRPSQASKGPRPQEGLRFHLCIRMTKENCVLGRIFRGPVHYQDWMDALDDDEAEAKRDHRHTRQTVSGNVYTKIRFQIVIAVHGSHYMSLPLYTHEGKGLQNKSEEAKMEFISIRDHRLPGPFFDQTDRGRLEATVHHPNRLDPQSAVQLSAPMYNQYDVTVEDVGMIAKDSLPDLLRNYRDAMTI